MPEVEVTGAFHQRIMVASELAWYPLGDSRNAAERLQNVRGQNGLGSCNLCWDHSVFRNLIHFLVFSLPKNGEEHFSYRVVIKLSNLTVKKDREG